MNGQIKMRLVPGISNIKLNGSTAYKNRVTSVIEAMTEVVTLIKLSNGTGNSKVRDSKGVVFWCNSEDLSDAESEYIFT